jgi:antitoxin (DNA-binding transcriptional repressor) of toxin-antitoxin stability system
MELTTIEFMIPQCRKSFTGLAGLSAKEAFPHLGNAMRASSVSSRGTARTTVKSTSYFTGIVPEIDPAWRLVAVRHFRAAERTCLASPQFANLSAMEVTIHHVETHLSKLIELAEHGEEIVIARAGQAVVKMVAVPAKPTRKLIGSAEGEIRVFDDSNPPETNKQADEFLNNGSLPDQKH